MMTHPLNSCISMFVLCAASALAAPPAEKGSLAALKYQADRWDQAIVEKDREAIERNIASNFMQIGSDGRVADKAAFVSALMDERLRLSPYTVQDFRVRIHGDAALLTGKTEMQGFWEGKPFTVRYRYTDVYIRENGRWLIANVQTTPILQPDD